MPNGWPPAPSSPGVRWEGAARLPAPSRNEPMIRAQRVRDGPQGHPASFPGPERTEQARCTAGRDLSGKPNRRPCFLWPATSNLRPCRGGYVPDGWKGHGRSRVTLFVPVRRGGARDDRSRPGEGSSAGSHAGLARRPRAGRQRPQGRVRPGPAGHGTSSRPGSAQALAARTHAELAVLTEDIPAVVQPGHRPGWCSASGQVACVTALAAMLATVLWSAAVVGWQCRGRGGGARGIGPRHLRPVRDRVPGTRVAASRPGRYRRRTRADRLTAGSDSPCRAR